MESDRDFRVQRVAAPLRQSVTESIRNAIAVGRFKAGESLTERSLCEMTGVSRTLVREALRQLESEGLVEVIPYRGPRVAKLSVKQAKGVYQVRASLEGLAAKLYAQQASAEQKAALLQEFDNLKASYHSKDAVTRLEAKNRFYEQLIEGSGNEALGDTLHILNSRVTILRATSLQAPGRAEQSLAEIQELVDALMAGNAERAMDAAEHHIANAAAIAIARLGADEDPKD